MLEVPDFESSTGVYGIVECTQCGLALTNPRPIESELPKLYEARTTADFPEMQSRFVGRLRDWAIDRYVVRQLAGVPLPKGRSFRALDFGCGDGALARGLVRYVERHGGIPEIAAVDFHDEPPASLEAAGERLRYSSYAQWLASRGHHEAVFLRHVLEHHPDPVRLLRELRSVLEPGGRLMIEVPNRRSVWAKLFGPYYSGFYIPRHLMHFDARSLRRVVENSGLRCVGLSLGHTPLLGRSIAYRTGRDVGNLGAIGLATYPAQVALDVLGGASSTLRLIATRDE
ncbi:MAG TPA: class I SAM-dependent methyltransferase [Usitatibacter sp.]|nr:class I SAM-dependent methyltransferase [Usitatibacter sp.]